MRARHEHQIKRELKNRRFNMFLTPSDIAAIEAWAWANHIRSLSEAVRQLVHKGIAAPSDEQAEANHSAYWKAAYERMAARNHELAAELEALRDQRRRAA